jgi:hypothetical protein
MMLPSNYFFLFLGIFSAIYIMLVFIPDRAISGYANKLGTGGYDYNVAVSAPSFSGPFLDSFSMDLSASRFGPWIRRMLLNTNHIEMIRELASQVTLPPVYYPMIRVSDAQWTEAASAALIPGKISVYYPCTCDNISDTILCLIVFNLQFYLQN